MEYLAYITSFIEVLPAWFGAIGSVVLAAKSITILTKTKRDDKILNVISKILNVLALNVLNDKNADA